jgi:hypothetical protein
MMQSTDVHSMAPAPPAAGAASPAPDSVTNIRPGDHLCILYETEEQHQQVFRAYLRRGLENGEKVLYIADERSPEAIERSLRATGLDTGPYTSSGQLAIVDSSVYTPSGAFDPDATLAMLGEALDDALAQGYAGLRATGEMTWSCRSMPGAERLMEYEAKLNHLIPRAKFAGVCQYDMRRFPPGKLRDALTTHPYAILGTEVMDNFYYVPPELYLSERREQAVTDRWLDNLRAYRAFQEEHLRSRMQELELERLRVLRRMQADFINEAAHEFATPMTPLRVQLDVLRRSLPPGAARAQQSLDVMDRSLTRLSTALQRVVEASKRDADKAEAAGPGARQA